MYLCYFCWNVYYHCTFALWFLLYWCLVYIREGISDLRIYVAVTSPYPRDRGVIMIMNAILTKMSCFWIFIGSRSWSQFLSQYSQKCLIYESLWALRHHYGNSHKMFYFWVSPHRGLRSRVSILMSASPLSADLCSPTSNDHQFIVSANKDICKTIENKKNKTSKQTNKWKKSSLS